MWRCGWFESKRWIDNRGIELRMRYKKIESNDENGDNKGEKIKQIDRW